MKRLLELVVIVAAIALLAAGIRRGQSAPPASPPTRAAQAETPAPERPAPPAPSFAPPSPEPVRLDRRPEYAGFSSRGVRPGLSRLEIEALLGAPGKEGELKVSPPPKPNPLNPVRFMILGELRVELTAEGKVVHVFGESLEYAGQTVLRKGDPASRVLEILGETRPGRMTTRRGEAWSYSYNYEAGDLFVSTDEDKRVKTVHLTNFKQAGLEGAPLRTWGGTLQLSNPQNGESHLDLNQKWDGRSSAQEKHRKSVQELDSLIHKKK